MGSEKLSRDIKFPIFIEVDYANAHRTLLVIPGVTTESCFVSVEALLQGPSNFFIETWGKQHIAVTSPGAKRTKLAFQEAFCALRDWQILIFDGSFRQDSIIVRTATNHNAVQVLNWASSLAANTCQEDIWMLLRLKDDTKPPRPSYDVEDTMMIVLRFTRNNKTLLELLETHAAAEYDPHQFYSSSSVSASIDACSEASVPTTPAIVESAAPSVKDQNRAKIMEWRRLELSARHHAELARVAREEIAKCFQSTVVELSEDLVINDANINYGGNSPFFVERRGHLFQWIADKDEKFTVSSKRKILALGLEKFGFSIEGPLICLNEGSDASDDEFYLVCPPWSTEK